MTYAYIPVTITNSESTATSTDFQQLVNVDLSYYTSSLNSDLSNTFFSSDTAGSDIITSWLESGNTYPFNSVNFWIYLPNGVGASSSITVYLQVDLSNTSHFNDTTTGVAPNLTSTYAEYDDGANVFTNYFNFAGTTLDSRVSPITGITLTQNNGLSIAVSTTATTFYILTSVYQNSPFILESDETYYGVGTGTNANEQYGLVIDSSTSTSQNTGGGPGGTNYMVRISNGDTNPQIVYDTTNEVSGTRSYTSQYTAIDSFTQSPSEVTGTFDGTSTSYSTTALTSGYIGFYLYTAVANSNIATIQWLRTRTYPPNGVMPFVTAGTPSNFPYYNTTTYEDLL